MSIVLTLRVRMNTDDMHTSKHLADALRAVAQRCEENEYVENVRSQLSTDAGYTITRSVSDTDGKLVGEFTLVDMP